MFVPYPADPDKKVTHMCSLLGNLYKASPNMQGKGQGKMRNGGLNLGQKAHKPGLDSMDF